MEPRRRIIVRLFVRSYVVFARQKSAEDVSPWAIIITMAPEKLQGVEIKAATTTRFMWLTDDIAMRDFKSV